MTISCKTKAKFSYGVNEKRHAFPSFTRLLILFVLKTAFTFTINLTAEMQSPSQLMHASESLCVMNCQLNFQYKTATQRGTAPAEK